MAMTRKLKAKQKSTRKDIILVTGQSGIKVNECLKKIVNPEQILKVEKLMIEVFKEEIESEMESADDKETMTKILASPPLIQKQMWDKALKRLQNKLKRFSHATNKDLFVTFHASFYHQRKREFVSPINFLRLRSLQKRIKMIIVLVDDCYDIYRRLIADNEMFYEDVMAPKIKPEEAMIKSIWNLLTILSWREVEIAFSRKIAETLKVPFFVVAVKHPTFMIRRLISEPLEKLKIFYLAHPISSVRKRIYARTSAFSGELNNFAKHLLQKTKNVILFIHDTIDELRIKENNKRKYLPELSEG